MTKEAMHFESTTEAAWAQYYNSACRGKTHTDTCLDFRKISEIRSWKKKKVLTQFPPPEHIFYSYLNLSNKPNTINVHWLNWLRTCCYRPKGKELASHRHLLPLIRYHQWQKTDTWCQRGKEASVPLDWSPGIRPNRTHNQIPFIIS